MKNSIKCLKLLAIVFIFGHFAAAQTSNDVRSRFGSPVREFFQISPKITLDTFYGADKQFCRIIVSKKYSIDDRQPPVMPADKTPPAPEITVASIFEQLTSDLPPALKLGKVIKSRQDEGNCFTSNLVEYEKATVSKVHRVCTGETGLEVETLTVKWNRDECKIEAPVLK